MKTDNKGDEKKFNDDSEISIPRIQDRRAFLNNLKKFLKMKEGNINKCSHNAPDTALCVQRIDPHKPIK